MAHHDRVVATELHEDLPRARCPRERIARRRTAGEGDCGDPRVAHERRAGIAIRDQHGHAVPRHPRPEQDVEQRERRQRRRLGGLQHHIFPGDQRGTDLVRDQVHRVVERCDRGDHAERRPAVPAEPASPARGVAERERLALQQVAGGGREADGLRRAGRLPCRLGDGLAALGRDDASEPRRLGADQGCRALERLARTLRQLPVVAAEAALHAGDGALHGRRVADVHARDERVVLGIGDGQRQVARDPLAVDEPPARDAQRIQPGIPLHHADRLIRPHCCSHRSHPP